MQVVSYGGATTIVAMAGADVRVQLPAGTTAKVRDLTEKGASRPRSYGPFAGGGGAVALGGTGAVTAGGKAVKPAKADARAPRTAARVKRLPGGKVRLTLINVGKQMVHNLRFMPDEAPAPIEEQIDILPAGEEESIEFEVTDPGTYPFECTFHVQLGQVGTMTVEG